MVKDRPDITVLKQTKLWSVFAEKTKVHSDLVAKVEKLIELADQLLERIIETFPTYTIHNGIHQLNIIRLMGELLGNDIDKLTSLECALLLLSAYYHDIGMVFTEEERNNLRNEADFKIFLNKYPDAFLELNDKPDLPLEVAEWFCRWAHAKRVHQFLIGVGDDNLKWGTVSLRTILGNVCESHCWDIERLKEEIFNTNYLGNADTKFCSILLRLADILDFDRSRSPEAVYKYLGLGKRDTTRIKESDIEWRKHLSSDGFKFPIDDNHELIFVAGPDNPAVEHDLRDFLDTIDIELNKCKRLLRFCDNRWKSFDLPDRINRKNIIGQGYKYGDFKFSLDQDKVLNLLMGESLYDNQYVFVRELLQNAIDTSRYRKFYECSNGNSNFNCKNIIINEWTDADGYKWIRVDDFGMGMDESKILNYLLKVGNSYYNSSEFNVDKLTFLKRLNEDFTPISRFGIGLLSCFIIGDVVEISTKPINPKIGEENIRISIKGIDNFYVLQSGNDIPEIMPNGNGTDEGYRTEFGTSVAVRLNPRKEFQELKLELYLKEHVMASEVDICYGEGGCIDNGKNLVEKPFVSYYKENFNNDDIEKINKFLDIDYGLDYSIELIPIDITKNATTKNILGQILCVKLNIPNEFDDSDSDKMQIRINHNFKVIVSKQVKDRNEILEIELSHLKKYVKQLIRKEDPYYYYYWDSFGMSHNGIVLPKTTMDQYSRDGNALDFNTRVFKLNEGFHKMRDRIILFGRIALRDSMRADVSTSREAIKPFSWSLYSNLALSFSRGITDSKQNMELRSLDLFENFVDRSNLKLGNMLHDELIVSLDGWKKEDIIVLAGKRYSIDSLMEKIKNDGPIISNTLIFSEIEIWPVFTSSLIQCLLNINFEISIFIDGFKTQYIIGPIRTSPITESEKLFDSDFFILYKNSKLLKFRNYPLNLNHPFAKWLKDNSISLNEKYPGLLRAIINLLNNSGSYFFETNQMMPYINEINKNLARLKDLAGAEYHITKNTYLTIDDFHIDKLM